jgi:hypothetical protein
LKTAFRLAAIAMLQLLLHAQARAQAANFVTVHSQDGRFYLQSIPFDAVSPTMRGVTRVYATGQDTPLYEFDRGFDSVSSDSNNLILSDDGETIFYLIPHSADETREGLKSVTIYRHGRILRSYTRMEINDCEARRERCGLRYFNDDVIDRQKTLESSPHKRVLTEGASEEERFLNDFAVFGNGNTVYVTDSSKRTHMFDLNEGALAGSAPFADLYPTLKVLARVTNVELQNFEANWFDGFPRLKGGGEASRELARFLGMKEIDFTSPDPRQYMIYSVRVSANVRQDGSLEVEEIEADEGLPREKIVEFLNTRRFDVGMLPPVFTKFHLGSFDEGETFYFRKADKRLARRERQAQSQLENRQELGASAVVLDDRLIHLDEAGNLRVWRLDDGNFDAAATARFSRNDLFRLASDGRQLWALGSSKVFRWSTEEGGWKSLARFDPKRNPVKGFAVAGGVPLLVLQAGTVMNPVTGRVYSTSDDDQFELMKMESEVAIGPDVDGSERKTSPERYMPFQRFGSPLADAVAVLGTKTRLWIGISRGEWGGALYALNPANGTWVDHGDATGYVTGMTEDGSGDLLVSWSMDHMGDAGTRILRHGGDAEPYGQIPDADSKYYQTVAFNPFDDTLYGVEQGDVVAISDGGHTKIAGLDGPVFGRERMAVGVAPGIGGLLPIGPRALVVVPKQGLPWLLRDGRLERLTHP